MSQYDILLHFGNVQSLYRLVFFSLRLICFHFNQMGATCGKSLCGRRAGKKGNVLSILVQKFRKNRVFPVDQSSSSTSVSTVFICTTTRSDILMSRTDEEKAEELDQNDNITSSIRVKESGGSRVRPNDARGRRQPQSQMAFGYIELDTDIAVLLNDPNSKDLETKRPKAAK